jgi:hypothetical protein
LTQLGTRSEDPYRIWPQVIDAMILVKPALNPSARTASSAPQCADNGPGGLSFHLSTGEPYQSTRLSRYNDLAAIDMFVVATATVGAPHGNTERLVRFDTPEN